MAVDDNNPQPGGSAETAGSTTGELYTTEDLLWEPPEVSKAEQKPRTDWVVFGFAGALTLAFVAWGVIAPDNLGGVASGMLNGLIHYGGWGFVLAASAFVVLALWLAFSRYGNITLGRDDEAPQYNTLSWISMLFATGMGIGLMFYGVSEPLSHFTTPPPGTAGGTEAQAATTAMATTMFHWSLHPWAIYAVVGLAIAYGTYRRGRRQLISAAFTPLIGERNANGPVGKLIDVLAIFATLFGSACSLGLGTLQIAYGFQHLGWIPTVGISVLVGIIAALMVAFVVSAASGIDKGIQWLSNTNMVMAALLLLFLLVVGPTVYILDMIPTSLGVYLHDFFSMAARTEVSGGEGTGAWLQGWTIFYWAWWISWTPFVGMFIGKISRGRTIRQFVAGVILVPSVVSLVWFAILGGTAINLQSSGVDLAGQASAEAQLYGLLENFPWATAVSVVVAVLVAIFFVTGADSASIVMGTLSQRGANDPQKPMTVFWGVLIAVVAAIMLMVGEGGGSALDGLQKITILVAAPWTIVMLMLCVALVKDLRRDPMIVRSHKAQEVVTAAVVTGAQEYDGDFQIEISPAEDSGEAAREKDEEDSASAPPAERAAANGGAVKDPTP
ncbi:choline/carnitine/betaine transport [Spinactinospora alkalitolerans]|uniref:Choline/carnitine/betaine transport n=1 Tax=Spinactinospora alkalitolerans TaxID=687207 RepID=A0A852TZH6_9ACTN|nr:BCCT family transporter [Spinactinospora alkalitolerans]NYE49976.1 choline/carnitine/betaine transport [Spinactinospora alkalitolerans]